MKNIFFLSLLVGVAFFGITHATHAEESECEKKCDRDYPVTFRGSTAHTRCWADCKNTDDQNKNMIATVFKIGDQYGVSNVVDVVTGKGGDPNSLEDVAPADAPKINVFRGIGPMHFPGGAGVAVPAAVPTTKKIETKKQIEKKTAAPIVVKPEAKKPAAREEKVHRQNSAPHEDIKHRSGISERNGENEKQETPTAENHAINSHVFNRQSHEDHHDFSNDPVVHPHASEGPFHTSQKASQQIHSIPESVHQTGGKERVSSHQQRQGTPHGEKGNVGRFNTSSNKPATHTTVGRHHTSSNKPATHTTVGRHHTSSNKHSVHTLSHKKKKRKGGKTV